MSKLNIKYLDPKKITEYEGNAKIHTDEQVSKIAASIEKFGFDQPIVVDRDHVVIKGNGRRLASIKLNLSKVPVVVRDDLSLAEAAASRLADNRVAEGKNDQSKLQAEIERISSEMEGMEFDLSDMGFDDKELDFLTSDLGELDMDSIVQDMDEEIGRQEVHTAEAIDKAEDEVVTFKSVFGTNNLTLKQARTIRSIIAEADSDDRVQGFVNYLEEHLVA